MFSPLTAGGGSRSGGGGGGGMRVSAHSHSARSGSPVSLGDSALCLSAVLSDGGGSWCAKGTNASLNDASADDTGYGGLLDPLDEPLPPITGPRFNPIIGHTDNGSLLHFLDTSACDVLHTHACTPGNGNERSKDGQTPRDAPGAAVVCPHQQSPRYTAAGDDSDDDGGEAGLGNATPVTGEGSNAILTSPASPQGEARARRWRRWLRKCHAAARSEAQAFALFDGLPHTALYNPRRYAPSALTWGWDTADRVPPPAARAIVLLTCLNVGTDPPGVDRTNPPGLQCWHPPQLFGDKQKAAKEITAMLQRQYLQVLRANSYRLSLGPRGQQPAQPPNAAVGSVGGAPGAEPRESYTFTPFPDAAYEDLSRLGMVRKDPNLQPPAARGTFAGQPGFGGTKDRRVVVHYNGHGVPAPSAHGELWVFNKQFTKYMPVRAMELIGWVGVPALFILDTRRAGVWVEHLRKDLTPQLHDGDVLALAASDVRDLPANPYFPADLFTSALTTPMKIAVLWHCYRHPARYSQSVAQRMLAALDAMPPPPPQHGMAPPPHDPRRGRNHSRGGHTRGGRGGTSPHADALGEQCGAFTANGVSGCLEGLTRIYDAIADAIAFDLLPRDEYVRLYQTDTLVSALFRNYLLAQRVLCGLGGDPTSSPPLPTATAHPLWDTFDWQLDNFLAGFVAPAHLGPRIRAPRPHASALDVASPPPPPAMAALLDDLGAITSFSSVFDTPRGRPAAAPGPRRVFSPDTFANSFLESSLREFELWLNSSSTDALPPATGSATLSPFAWLFGQNDVTRPPPVNLPLALHALEVRRFQPTCLRMMCDFVDRHGAEAISLLLAGGLYPRLARITDDAADAVALRVDLRGHRSWSTGSTPPAPALHPAGADEALAAVLSAAPHLPSVVHLWEKIAALKDPYVASEVDAHAMFFLQLLLHLSPPAPPQASAAAGVPQGHHTAHRRSSGPGGFYSAKPQYRGAVGDLGEPGGDADPTSLRHSTASLNSLVSPEMSSHIRDAMHRGARFVTAPDVAISPDTYAGHAGGGPLRSARALGSMDLSALAQTFESSQTDLDSPRARCPEGGDAAPADGSAAPAGGAAPGDGVVGMKTMLAAVLVYVCRHSREGRMKVASRIVSAFEGIVAPYVAELSTPDGGEACGAAAFVQWMLLLLGCVLETDPSQVSYLGAANLQGRDSWLTQCAAAPSPAVRAATMHLLPLSKAAGRRRTTDTLDVQLAKLLAEACRDGSAWVRLACAHSLFSLCNTFGAGVQEEYDTTPSSEEKNDDNDCDHLLTSLAWSAAATLQNDPIKMISVVAGNTMTLLRSMGAVAAAASHPSPGERATSSPHTRSPISPSFRAFEPRDMVRHGDPRVPRNRSQDLSVLGEDEGLEAVNEALAHGPQEMIRRSPSGLSADLLSDGARDATREASSKNSLRDIVPPVAGEEVMLASVTRSTVIDAAFFMLQQRLEPTCEKSALLDWRTQHVDHVTRRCLAESELREGVRGRFSIVAEYDTQRAEGGTGALAVHPTASLACWGVQSSVRVWDWTRRAAFESYRIPAATGHIAHLDVLARYPVVPLLTCSAHGMVYLHCDWAHLRCASVVSAFRLADGYDFDMVGSFSYRTAALWGSAETATVRVADVATERRAEAVRVGDESKIMAMAAPSEHADLSLGWVGCSSGSVLGIDARAGRDVLRVGGHSRSPVTSVVHGEQFGGAAASVSEDGLLKIWDARVPATPVNGDGSDTAAWKGHATSSHALSKKSPLKLTALHPVLPHTMTCSLTSVRVHSPLDGTASVLSSVDRSASLFRSRLAPIAAAHFHPLLPLSVASFTDGRLFVLSY